MAGRIRAALVQAIGAVSTVDVRSASKVPQIDDVELIVAITEESEEIVISRDTSELNLIVARTGVERHVMLGIDIGERKLIVAGAHEDIHVADGSDLEEAGGVDVVFADG